MKTMPWFRLYTEARNDAKLRTLTVEERWVWFCLLCYAAEQDERGCVPPTDPFILAAEVAGGDEELLARTVAKLVRLKVVTDCEQGICFVNFTKRNYDKPSDSADATRERKRKQRETERDSAPEPTPPQPVTPPSRPVTPGHAQEKRRGEENRGDVGATHQRPRAADAATAGTAPPSSTEPVSAPESAPSNVMPLRAAPKPNRYGEVLDALKARGIEYQGSSRDAGAVKSCAASPALIAEAYATAAAGQWGGSVVLDNLSLWAVCPRIGAYQAWKAGVRAKPQWAGGHGRQPGELSMEDIKARANGERRAAP